MKRLRLRKAKCLLMASSRVENQTQVPQDCKAHAYAFPCISMVRAACKACIPWPHEDIWTSEDLTLEHTLSWA